MACSDAAAAVCQSCAMPMAAPGDFGAEADGSLCYDYCNFCYKQGSFTAPNLAMEDMIEKLVEFAPHLGQSPEQARERAGKTLPELKRWKQE